jgi:hypothetical protein
VAPLCFPTFLLDVFCFLILESSDVGVLMRVDMRINPAIWPGENWFETCCVEKEKK